MPLRYIYEELLTDERMARLSWGAEVFLRRLWSRVDDYGRFDARDSVLRAALYPLQLDSVGDRDVAKWKLETATTGLLKVYHVGSREILEIVDFNLRQKPRSSSKYPPPPEGDGVCGHLPADVGKCAQPPATARLSAIESAIESATPPPQTPPTPAIVRPHSGPAEVGGGGGGVDLEAIGEWFDSIKLTPTSDLRDAILRHGLGLDALKAMWKAVVNEPGITSKRGLFITRVKDGGAKAFRQKGA